MSWNDRLSDIMEFKQQWGHCHLLQKYAKSPKLVKWVSDQRSQYRLFKSGKKSFINNERIEQLEVVGFQWTLDSQLIRKTAWNEQFSELLEFKQEWGTVMFFKNVLNIQSSVIGWATREDNIDYWRVVRSPSPTMRGQCNWKMLDSNGLLIVSWYEKRPGMNDFNSYSSLNKSGGMYTTRLS